MEISYDKDLYLTFQKLKNSQAKDFKGNYHIHQRSLDLRKPCYTENSTAKPNIYVIK